MRLASVAAAMAPEDFSICDIGAKVPAPPPGAASGNRRPPLRAGESLRQARATPEASPPTFRGAIDTRRASGTRAWR